MASFYDPEHRFPTLGYYVKYGDVYTAAMLEMIAIQMLREEIYALQATQRQEGEIG